MSLLSSSTYPHPRCLPSRVAALLAEKGLGGDGGVEAIPEDAEVEGAEGTVSGDFHAINSASVGLLSAASGGGVRGSIRLPEPLHQTDTASIRRRYMALEKGPGFTKTDLLFANPEKLFQSTVTLEFDEDSPSFRQKLQAMDENVEGMRNHLQRLVSIIQKYIEAGLAFSNVGRRFSSELMHLEGESWFTRLGDLAPALVRFGEAFDEIQNYRDAVVGTGPSRLNTEAGDLLEPSCPPASGSWAAAHVAGGDLSGSDARVCEARAEGGQGPEGRDPPVPRRVPAPAPALPQATQRSVSTLPALYAHARGSLLSEPCLWVVQRQTRRWWRLGHRSSWPFVAASNLPASIRYGCAHLGGTLRLFRLCATTALGSPSCWCGCRSTP